MVEINIVPAEKTEEDGKLIMKWRNDETTRINSFNSEKKSWDKFKHEYLDYFKNLPLFATVEGTKFAFVSICDYGTSSKSIGINISPNYRGKGLSRPVIMATIDYIKKHFKNIQELFAEIKNFNIPSIRAFSRSGFEYFQTIKKGDDKVLVYKYSI